MRTSFARLSFAAPTFPGPSVAPLVGSRGTEGTEFDFLLAEGAWFSFCAEAAVAGAWAGLGAVAVFAFASSARLSHGFTVGGAASWRTTILGSSFGALSFSFFFPLLSGFAVPSLPFDPFCRSFRSAIQAGSDAWDLVSHVMSEDEPVGADGDSSLVAVDAVEEPAVSGDDRPDAPFSNLSSAFARSTALSFGSDVFLSSPSTFCAPATFDPSLSSTSSAQLPPLEASSDIELAGVAAPDAVLLEDVCDAGAAVPRAACAYEKPLGLGFPTAIARRLSDLLCDAEELYEVEVFPQPLDLRPQGQSTSPTNST